METRLAAALSVAPLRADVAPVRTMAVVETVGTAVRPAPAREPLPGVPEAEDAPPPAEALEVPPGTMDEPPPGFDETAEASFLADARERGEVVRPRAAEETEEAAPAALPSLDSLVQRIPPEVRDALEDLFRARFVSVKRVPKKALKSQ